MEEIDNSQYELSDDQVWTAKLRAVAVKLVTKLLPELSGLDCLPKYVCRLFPEVRGTWFRKLINILRRRVKGNRENEFPSELQVAPRNRKCLFQGF